MARPRKRYVLYLVEGYTDIEVLSEPLLNLYEENASSENVVEIKFCLLHQGNQKGGDITSNNGITPANIEGLVSKLFIDPFLEKNPFVYPKEISEIIQIIDLDGAFVDDNMIFQHNEGIGKRTIYKENGIFTVDVDMIKQRNRRKRENIRKLVSMNQIVIRPKNGRNTKKVNYSCYYFSCNMDHYFHGNPNLSPQEKRIKAEDFMLECYGDTKAFCEKIYSNPGTMKSCTISESWDYIMERGDNSLNSHSNINILIESIKQFR